MKKIITGAELAALFHNILSTETDENGALRLHRFTKKQESVYEAQSNIGTNGNYGPVALANSGAVIEFVTDSSFVGMQFGWKDVVGYPYACFDFYVDGVHYDSCYIENPRYNIFAFDVPEGKHHVQIFFPWNADVRTESIVLSEGALCEPAPAKSLRILAIGDSITQGYVGIHPAYSYTNHMGRSLHAEVLNQAVGGYYFEKSSLDPEVALWKPDLITLAYGTNDYYHKMTLTEYREGCEGFCEKLHEIFPETRVLGIMPIYRNDERFVARRKLWSYEFAEGLEALRATYAKYPQITVLEDTFFPHHKDYFYEDFLHPNDAGFQVYGEAVTRAIRSMNCV